jgi:1-acyl-sn-glycerol-3-phosphate acyltransferase
VELLHRVEKEFGMRLREEAVVEARTVRDVLSVIVSAAPSIEPPSAQRLAAPPVSRGRIRAAPDTAATLIEILEWHAAMNPDRIHIRLYQDQGEGEPIRYRELLDGARRKAAALQSLGVAAGQPVVLMLQTGRDYFLCFFAVLLAGGIPVPIYPPARPAQIEDHIRRQQGILDNCAAPVMISMPEARTAAWLMTAQVPSLRHVVTPADLDTAPGDYIRPVVRAEDLALLQYTSGSTGRPKGVMLTHANLLSNIRLMGAQIRATSDDVFVSWLPLYHDMGLIGAWLGSLCFAVEFVVMSPLAFIARPERWLWAIHRYRGTLSASPNFGYELCLRRLEDSELAGLDLGSWRIAFNGAEPVSPETLRRFTERFGRFGFRSTAPTPVYGLAECSLGLTFPPLDRGPLIDRIDRERFLREGRAVPAGPGVPVLEFVSCGMTLPQHALRIVDDAGRARPEREVGHLQFRGPSATRGYYRNPEATRTLLRDGWLDSGDLAYLAGGELYLTGREKDLIIHAGRNLYPQEMEEAIGRLSGVRAGRVAAFGARDPALGTERLIVVAETRLQDEDGRQRLRAEINAIVTELTGGPPDDVVLALPGTVLKTPSGKVRRAAIKERYERGEITKPPPAPWRQILGLFLQGLPARASRVAHRIGALAYGLYAQLVFWLIAPPAWLAAVLLPALGLRWQATRIALRMATALMGIRLTVKGGEYLEGKARILATNHASYVDGAILMLALRHPVSFVAKAELRRNFFVRLFLERIGAEFVERIEAIRGVEDVRRLARRAREGTPLLFFPEGTFARAAGLRPFRMGTFMTAAEARIPIVPIALRGTRLVLPSGTWYPSPGHVVITVSPPIVPSEQENDRWKVAVSLREKVRAEILRHCGEPDLAGDLTRPWLGEAQ